MGNRVWPWCGVWTGKGRVGETRQEMRQQPRKTKYRKAFKGKVGGGVGGARITHGRWALRSTKGARLTARQLEASRRALRRRLQRRGRVWRGVFPWLPVSAKPAEVRRGKGKGSVSFWATRVQPGAILFEVDGVTAAEAKEALVVAGAKRPRPTTVSVRRRALDAS